MNGSELLHEAGALVEQGWCQGTEARDASGAVIDAGDRNATAWSLLGALQATTAGDPTTRIEDVGDAVAALAELIMDPSLANWNDAASRTKLEVLALLEDAEVLALAQVATYRDPTQN